VESRPHSLRMNEQRLLSQRDMTRTGNEPQPASNNCAGDARALGQIEQQLVEVQAKPTANRANQSGQTTYLRLPYQIHLKASSPGAKKTAQKSAAVSWGNSRSVCSGAVFVTEHYPEVCSAVVGTVGRRCSPAHASLLLSGKPPTQLAPDCRNSNHPSSRRTSLTSTVVSAPRQSHARGASKEVDPSGYGPRLVATVAV